MNAQKLGATLTKIVGIAALVMGPLTATLPSLGLPVAVSTAITTVGGIILAIERWLTDPSTGNSPPPGG